MNGSVSTEQFEKMIPTSVIEPDEIQPRFPSTLLLHWGVQKPGNTEVATMGRIRGHRDKLKVELASVRHKTLENALIHETRRQFALCEAECEVVVRRALNFLRYWNDQQGIRICNQVVIPLPGQPNETRKSDLQVLPRPISLTPVAHDDLDIWQEFGASPMQTARVIRLVEQADRNNATMMARELARLVSLSRQTIGRRLKVWWKQGFRLPIQGSKPSWQGQRTRLAEVFRAHLLGRSCAQTRDQLLLSPGQWQHLFWCARSVAGDLIDGYPSERIGNALGLGAHEIESVQTVLRQADGDCTMAQNLQQMLQRKPKHPLENETSFAREQFESLLIREHSFSPCKAELYVNMVEDKAAASALDIDDHQIVYHAIAADEPGGKQLSQCRLVPVRLSYVDDEDYVGAGRSTEVKSNKLIRFATQAKAQGGLLTLPDLAFLLGIASQTVGRLLASIDVYVPTRGRECDLGPGVSHKTKIVKLYVAGYTEVEIARRTQHTLDSVATYLRDFTTVVVLKDRGLPPAHIRKVTGRSKKLTNAYLDLYEEVNTAENQWKLNLMRRGFEARQEKKRSGA